MTRALASMAIAQRSDDRTDHALIERVRKARADMRTHEGFRVEGHAFQPTHVALDPRWQERASRRLSVFWHVAGFGLIGCGAAMLWGML